ncbi:MAG: TIGR02266 family protein, partial [Desulfuromonadales bacterium]|nr:TIGR02266 family protein [Desulfuromonadales bacterium]NIS40977.1 TIGR02266 family protein [Desulfuromonadales bacterium]
MADQKTILLADDVELFLELEKTFFRRENFRLLVARNGREAFDIVSEHKPDLVFLDLYMPEMTGDECCRQVKNDPELKSTPVIMVTHGGREADLNRCREAGCDDIVLKPINRHNFLNTARRHLSVADREAQRISARLHIQHGAVGEEQTLRDYTVNLSTGGVFIETDTPLPADTPLQIRFDLPGRAVPIECRGEVAWVNRLDKPIKAKLPAGMGVQFIDLSLEDLGDIREYVKEQCLFPSW